MRKIMITAAKSGGGKTLITCGLLEVLKEMGEKPRAFKCGPDFIDPMFHKKLLGIESENLDSFFLEEKQLREFFEARTGEEEIAVIEGVMGYFDGIGGDTPRGSASEIAQMLDCPALLIVDARKASLSLAASVSGFLSYRPRGFEAWENKIAGVILNQASPVIYERLKKVIERDCSVPVVGYVPVMENCRLESRHLGLVMPEEIENFKQMFKEMAPVLSKTLNLGKILEISESRKEKGEKKPSGEPEKKEISHQKDFCLAIARDRAFNFYYEENLRLLRENGAELLEFSPVSDREIPPEADGLLLGGGYPELFAGELEKNSSMRNAVRAAIKQGMPVLAECGGFLYLLDSLQDEEGREFQMAGVFEGKSARGKTLGNFGYITVEGCKDGRYLKAGEHIKGHEYHYWKTENEGKDGLAVKPSGNRQWSCIHQTDRVFAGFPHLYYRSMPEFPKRFAKECRKYRREKKEGIKP